MTTFVVRMTRTEPAPARARAPNPVLVRLSAETLKGQPPGKGRTRSITKQVTRNGKTFTQRFWVRDEAPAGASVHGRGAAPTTGPITHAELQAAAATYTGGGSYRTDAPDAHGQPLFVPHDDPHPAWDRLRVALARRIGDVGDPPAARMAANAWDNGSITTPVELHRVAEATKPSWVSAVEAIAAATPGARPYMGEDNVFATKGLGSLTRKVTDRAAALVSEGEAATEAEAQARTVQTDIFDAVRGSIVVDHPEDLRRAVETARAVFARLGGQTIVENKWAVSSGSGYTAIHAAVRFPTPDGGFINAELQFHPAAMVEPKDLSHTIYEVTRSDGFAGDPLVYGRASKVVWLAALMRMHREP